MRAQPTALDPHCGYAGERDGRPANEDFAAVDLGMAALLLLIALPPRI